MSDCGHGAAIPVLPVFTAATTARLVALVGPPNSGKSTLFNQLTGLRQKVANYPGVTVERHVGRALLADRRAVDIVDLPGVYSLSPRSEDERVTRDVLLGTMPNAARPDAVLLILDSTNLARGLTMAAPVLSLGLPTMVVLNMSDELAGRGGSVDVARLADELGVSVALVSATQGDGIDEVIRFLTQAIPAPRRLELPILQDVPQCRRWAAGMADSARYTAPAPPIWTRRLDGIFLHRLWGPVVFAVVVALVFEIIFAGAQPLMDGVDFAIGSSGQWLRTQLPDTIWRSLLIEGVWSGVGSVVIFLPQILLLFLFIGILEDSGYLARAALIADRTMARAGLQGKSFIPLVSAYACAVPAIMSTRTIENRRDRIATILIAPFMTCSARLPIYVLIIAAFVPNNFGWRAGAMISLYVLGFAAAYVTALLLKSSVLKSERTPFILEMPPYRWPTWQSLALRLLDRAKIFLRRAGTVILLVAIVLWVLANIPLKDGKPPKIEDSVAAQIGHGIEPLIKPLGFDWRIGISLLSSLAAREVIVGTLGTIYGIEKGKDGAELQHSPGLQEALRRDLTPGAAAALLVFFAFAMQCMSTVAVVRRETGGWKWPAIQFSYMFVLAWVGAYAAHGFFS